MCGGENWLPIVLVLSVKKVAKSSAVIEVVGGGGGGQRRELNVLLSLLLTLRGGLASGLENDAKILDLGSICRCGTDL